MAVCFVIAGVFFSFRNDGSWYTRVVCPWFAVVGAGLWLKHSWARWVMFAFFSILALLAALVVFRTGISGQRIVQGIIIAGAITALWQWDVYPPEELSEAKAIADPNGFNPENRE